MITRCTSGTIVYSRMRQPSLMQIFSFIHELSNWNHLSLKSSLCFCGGRFFFSNEKNVLFLSTLVRDLLFRFFFCHIRMDWQYELLKTFIFLQSDMYLELNYFFELTHFTTTKKNGFDIKNSRTSNLLAFAKLLSEVRHLSG